MRKTLYAAAAVACGAFFFAGCMSVEYTGEAFPESQYVKVFFDPSFVPPSRYKKIGDGKVEAPEGYLWSDINAKLISKGREIGADAVLVGKIDRKVIGSYEVSDGKEPNSDGMTAALPSATGILPDQDRASEGIVCDTETIVKVTYYKLIPVAERPKSEAKEKGVAELHAIEEGIRDKDERGKPMNQQVKEMVKESTVVISEDIDPVTGKTKPKPALQPLAAPAVPASATPAPAVPASATPAPAK